MHPYEIQMLDGAEAELPQSGKRGRPGPLVHAHAAGLCGHDSNPSCTEKRRPPALVNKNWTREAEELE